MPLQDSDTSQLLMTVWKQICLDVSDVMQVCVVWLIGGFLYYGITLSAGSISKEVNAKISILQSQNV